MMNPYPTQHTLLFMRSAVDKAQNNAFDRRQSPGRHIQSVWMTEYAQTGSDSCSQEGDPAKYRLCLWMAKAYYMLT